MAKAKEKGTELDLSSLKGMMENMLRSKVAAGLKAALKANMARRKAQVRGRKNAAGADEADKDEG